MKHDIISPLNDFAFAQIFGNQRNIENTERFLKSLLDIPEDEYDRLTVVSPILGRLFRKGKTGIVDLKLSTKSGKVIHIELQVEKRANLRNRILYYASRLVGDQLRWGDDYKKLNQVISIVICNHNLLEEENSYINVYELRNEEKRSFTNLLKVVILELPKIPEDKDRAVWPWLKFFTCKEKEEYEMLVRKHPELKDAVFCAKKMSVFEKWRDIQFHKNLWKADERALLEQAMIDGRAEGRAQGRAEGHAQGKEIGKEIGRAEGRAEGEAKGIQKGEIIGEQKERQRFLSMIDQGLSLEEIKQRL